MVYYAYYTFRVVSRSQTKYSVVFLSEDDNSFVDIGLRNISLRPLLQHYVILWENPGKTFHRPPAVRKYGRMEQKHGTILRSFEFFQRGLAERGLGLLFQETTHAVIPSVSPSRLWHKILP